LSSTASSVSLSAPSSADSNNVRTIFPPFNELVSGAGRVCTPSYHRAAERSPLVTDHDHQYREVSKLSPHLSPTQDLQGSALSAPIHTITCVMAAPNNSGSNNHILCTEIIFVRSIQLSCNFHAARFACLPPCEGRLKPEDDGDEEGNEDDQDDEASVPVARSDSGSSEVSNSLKCSCRVRPFPLAQIGVHIFC